MIASLKSELRKLLTVRSTYFVSIIAIGFVILLTWIMVWDISSTLKAEQTAAQAQISESPPPAPEGEPFDAAKIAADHQQWLATRQREVVMNSFSTVTTFIVIIVILQIIHEYRYNTIMYTLTSSRSRTKVFLSKLAVLMGFSVVMGFVAVLASLATYTIALGYFDVTLPAQQLGWAGALLRGSLYCVAFASFGAIIAFLSRNIALAIAAFLIVPSTVENLLGLWLKHNTVYLPFSSMSQIVLYNPQAKGSLDFKHAVMTTAIYLLVLYALTWYLFIKRDAN